MSKKTKRSVKLLTLIPWLFRNGEATFGELCKRFKYEPRELLSDLMTFSMVGIAPYTPLELTSIYFIPEEEVYDAYDSNQAPDPDWSVQISREHIFVRPPNLTPEEVFILLTAYSAIREFGLSVDSAFETAVSKIKTAVLPEQPIQEASVDIGLEQVPEQLLKPLQTAEQKKLQIEIEYHSLRENQHSSRHVEPWKIYYAEGAWYMKAYCHMDVGERLFRLARITGTKLTDKAFSQAVPKDIDAEVYTPESDAPEVILELDSSARWALDQFVAKELKYLPERKIHARLKISNQEFLEKLLLQIGRQGRIISGDYSMDLQKLAAEKLLKKHYENK